MDLRRYSQHRCFGRSCCCSGDSGHRFDGYLARLNREGARRGTCRNRDRDWNRGIRLTSGERNNKPTFRRDCVQGNSSRRSAAPFHGNRHHEEGENRRRINRQSRRLGDSVERSRDRSSRLSWNRQGLHGECR